MLLIHKDMFLRLTMVQQCTIAFIDMQENEWIKNYLKIQKMFLFSFTTGSQQKHKQSRQESLKDYDLSDGNEDEESTPISPGPVSSPTRPYSGNNRMNIPAGDRSSQNVSLICHAHSI